MRGCPHVLSAAFVFSGADPRTTPLRLHPENPHYFLFRGRPLVIITSGEHYGAVLNADFDMRRYLDTLAAEGMNGTRIFSSAYVEPQGAFGIVSNTLAPAPGRFLCPWARSDAPGYAGGGNKFDLSRWDAAYFARLRTFMREAAHHGIIVEVNLFCPFYTEAQWRLSPMNGINMSPAPELFRQGLPPDVHVEALAGPGREYAVYLYRMPGAARETQCTLSPRLPAGTWEIRWVMPADGKTFPAHVVRHSGGTLSLATPPFEQDLALCIRRRPEPPGKPGTTGGSFHASGQ